MKKAILFLTSLLMVVSFSAHAEKSPFTDVVYKENSSPSPAHAKIPTVAVTFEEKDYYLLSVNDVKIQDIMSKCQAAFASDCQENFALNFLQTMTAVGIKITNDSAKIVLYNFKTHFVSTVEAAVLTEDNSEEIVFNWNIRAAN